MLVCFVLIGVAFSALSESAAEIAYDDGTAEAERGCSTAGSGFAVRFTPAEAGDMLLRVRIYFTGWVGDPTPIEVHVWDAAGSDLVSPVLAAPAAAGWFDVEFPSARPVLTGDVYVGYLQTSGDNYPWLGIDTTAPSERSYSVPEWAPLLPAGAGAMIRVLLQHPLASEDGLELAYDDGSAETARGYAVAGAGYAVRFTPPAGGAVLETARLYVSGFQGDPAPIEVHVWNAGGADLIPPFDALPTEEGWFEIDLSGAALRVAADFSVGYLQMDNANYPWLGIDIGNPNARSYSAPDWNMLLPSGTNAMIRVIFAGSER